MEYNMEKEKSVRSIRPYGAPFRRPNANKLPLPNQIIYQRLSQLMTQYYKLIICKFNLGSSNDARHFKSLP